MGSYREEYTQLQLIASCFQKTALFSTTISSLEFGHLPERDVDDPSELDSNATEKREPYRSSGKVQTESQRKYSQTGYQLLLQSEPASASERQTGTKISLSKAHPIKARQRFDIPAYLRRDLDRIALLPSVLYRIRTLNLLEHEYVRTTPSAPCSCFTLRYGPDRTWFCPRLLGTYSINRCTVLLEGSFEPSPIIFFTS